MPLGSVGGVCVCVSGGVSDRRGGSRGGETGKVPVAGWRWSRERCFSCPSGEAERDSRDRGGGGAPGVALSCLSLAVPPVGLCKEASEEPDPGRSPGGRELVPARVTEVGVGGGRGRAGREAAGFLSGSQVAGLLPPRCGGRRGEPAARRARLGQATFPAGPQTVLGWKPQPPEPFKWFPSGLEGALRSGRGHPSLSLSLFFFWSLYFSGCAP